MAQEAVAARPAEQGLHLYGVIRAGGLRGFRLTGPHKPQHVRYRDLEALVRPAPYDLTPFERDALLEHQRVVESAMRRATILPAPYGVVFRGRRALVRFLESQYLVLDEALAFLDGHWELRLHVSASGAAAVEAELVEVCTRLYNELRRLARAAIPFPRNGERLLSAAFLVDRTAWVGFVGRAHELVTGQPELSFDITGPWPPYDFVKMTL